jgi:hypothetical protein
MPEYRIVKAQYNHDTGKLFGRLIFPKTYDTLPHAFARARELFQTQNSICKNTGEILYGQLFENRLVLVFRTRGQETTYRFEYLIEEV